MALTTALGGLIGGTGNKKTETGQSSASATPTYTAGQTGLQGALEKVLSTLLPGVASGEKSQNVQALETAGAEGVNRNYVTLGDRMNRFLAARGFGKSGKVGAAALETELGRQGALAKNATDAAGLQLDQNNELLSNALRFAFANPGSSTTSSYNNVSGGSSLASALAGAYAGFQDSLNQAALFGGF
jgi:hypothetical protein